MTFPVRVPAHGAVLHEIDDAGAVQAAPRKVCTVPSAGGLWSTTADLATFALRWRTLLPEALAFEALSPQAPRGHTLSIGFGFLLGEASGHRIVGHTGGGIGAASSLLLLPDDEVAAVSMANRPAKLEPMSAAALGSALRARA